MSYTYNCMCLKLYVSTILVLVFAILKIEISKTEFMSRSRSHHQQLSDDFIIQVHDWKMLLHFLSFGCHLEVNVDIQAHHLSPKGNIDRSQ